MGSSPIFRPIRKSPRFRAGFFFFCRWLRPDSPSAALCREPRPGVRKDKSRLYSRVHGRGYASFAGKGLREILFRRGGKGQVRPACSLSSLSIDGALSAVVICLASERGLRSCPAGGGFSLRQATPLASRRAALAKAGPFAYKTSHHGAWRSMVAHLLWEQGVAGSIPAAPTKKLSAGSICTFLGGYSRRPLSPGSGAIAQQGERRPCTAVRRVQSPLAPPKRRDGRAADCGGLENC